MVFVCASAGHCRSTLISLRSCVRLSVVQSRWLHPRAGRRGSLWVGGYRRGGCGRCAWWSASLAQWLKENWARGLSVMWGGCFVFLPCLRATPAHTARTRGATPGALTPRRDLGHVAHWGGYGEGRAAVCVGRAPRCGRRSGWPPRKGGGWRWAPRPAAARTQQAASIRFVHHTRRPLRWSAGRFCSCCSFPLQRPQAA